MNPEYLNDADVNKEKLFAIPPLYKCFAEEEEVMGKTPKLSLYDDGYADDDDDGEYDDDYYDDDDDDDFDDDDYDDYDDDYDDDNYDDDYDDDNYDDGE